MLTTCQAEADRVKGLDLGADDYVIKPFLSGELLARVRALLRRSARPLQHDQREILTIDELLVDTRNRRVFRGDEELHLGQKEFDLLVCLMSNRGVALSRQVLLEQFGATNLRMMHEPSMCIFAGCAPRSRLILHIPA